MVLSWNDASAFSFFGVYEIENFGKKTGEIGLHWLDAIELRIEPKDLKSNFIDFYTECSRHPKVPLIAAIEKKSTGVTLLSTLKEIRGLSIREIERTRASGSKTQRFLEMQPFVASKIVSFTKDAKHINLCVKHMTTITANNSHRHDDLADNLYDGIKMALIDKSIYSIKKDNSKYDRILSGLSTNLANNIKAGRIINDPNRQKIF
jgi:predicted phage terminase large subunit-like protein